MKFGKTEIAKETFYATKKRVKIWDVNVDNIVVSELVKTKTNSKYFIRYLDRDYLHKDIRPLVLIMSKMSGYLKTFKVQDAVNKLPFFHIDDEKLLEKYKAI